MLAHARPARRSVGLHAAVRPRPGRGARPRRRRGRAGHLPLPLRPGAARGAGYAVQERFYRRSSRPGLGAAGAGACCAPPSTSRTCCATGAWPRRADVVHYQWLPIPALDRRLLPPKRPRVYTMHWRLPEAGTRIARRSPACWPRWTRWSSTPSTARGASRRDFGVPRRAAPGDPPRRLRLPDPPAGRDRRCRPSCGGSRAR